MCVNAQVTTIPVARPFLLACSKQSLPLQNRDHAYHAIPCLYSGGHCRTAAESVV